MFGLSERSYKELLDILSSIPEIEETIIYGSRARGDYWAASDIDLSLKGSKLTQHHLTKLNQKLYESHIPLFFDTHIYANIKNLRFKQNIDRDGKTLYQRK
mgnify:CR=1 FL=1